MRAKRTGGVAQKVECLSPKQEALSSNPCTGKKEKERKKRKRKKEKRKKERKKERRKEGKREEGKVERKGKKEGRKERKNLLYFERAKLLTQAANNL
jgi:hypothetical protein